MFNRVCCDLILLLRFRVTDVFGFFLNLFDVSLLFTGFLERENMTFSFTRLSSWSWLCGKAKDEVLKGSSVNSANSLDEWGLGFRGELESLKLYSRKRVDDDGGGGDKRMLPSKPKSKKAKKRKWKNREMIIDKDHNDLVFVPPDGVCFSGSESDGSDWSIGWLEPHAPDFQSDDSFAVLVPCYRHEYLELEERDENNTNQNGGYYEGDREYMERWLLSSLQKF